MAVGHRREPRWIAPCGREVGPAVGGWSLALAKRWCWSQAKMMWSAVMAPLRGRS